MKRPGYFVRLVDVVLILLFGFISISNAKDSALDLVESQELNPTAVDNHEIIFMGVLDDGRYFLEKRGAFFDDLQDVRTYLLQEHRLRSDVPMKVRIRASKNAPAQQVFALAELCKEVGFENTLEVKIELD